jgi:hypothetical protein
LSAVREESAVDDPFDAGKVRLTEERWPLRHRRPVSLISGLLAAMTESAIPDNDHNGLAMRELVDALTDRGFDGDSLVRYGLIADIAVAIAFRASSKWITDLPEHPDSEAWLEVLGLSNDETSAVSISELTAEPIMMVLQVANKVLAPWIMSARLTDLVELLPPSIEEVEDCKKQRAPDPSILESYRWIIDRFGVTHLRGWSTQSLHRESRWINGLLPAPCAEDLMTDRTVDSQALDKEIARRVVAGQSSLISLPGFNAALLHQVQDRATKFLAEGRFSDATALYKLAVSQAPDNAYIINNLGFCCIPEDPDAALRYLNRAHDLGYSPAGINAHNRAVCHTLKNDYRTALAILEDAWFQVDEMGTNCTLWMTDSSELKLVDKADCRLKSAELARHCAVQLDDEQLTSKWTKRLSELAD